MPENIQLRQIFENRYRIIKDEYFCSSVSSVLSSLEEPFNQIEAATKASENPSHEHYKKSITEICNIWNTKASIGASSGNDLDDFIQYWMDEDYIKCTKIMINLQTSERVFNQCVQFIKFYRSFFIKHFQHLLYEVNIASRLGFNGRMDELCRSLKSMKSVIIDWKQNEKIDVTNMFRKKLGPLKHLDDTKYVRYTTQLHLYQYALETEFPMTVDGSLIVQITQSEFKIWPPAYTYSKSLVEDILQYHKNPHNNG